MYLFKKHVSRRTVLKGVGATIALPLLDAMNPAATAWAQTPAGSTPKRFAFVGFPHGAIMDRWSPAQTGANYEMSPILQPLEPFRQHLTIVSGLRNKPGETPEPHGYIEMTWLTLREAVGPRRGRSGCRRQRRPVRRAAHRPGHAAAVARAHDGARRRARGVADADAVAAAGRQSARGVSEAVRPGRYRQGTCGDSPRDRQHPRPRQGAGGAAAGQPRRARPRRRERLPRLGPRDRAARADGVAAGHVAAGHSGRAGRHAERPHRALQADVRSDGARVPGGHHPRHHVLDGSRSEHAHVHQPRHRRRVPSALASREQRGEAGQAGADSAVPHRGVREVRRAAVEGAGGATAPCSITRRSSSAAT